MLSKYSKDVLDNAKSVDLAGDKFCKIYDDGMLLLVIGMMTHDGGTAIYIDYDDNHTCTHLGDEFGDEKAAQLEILF